MREFDVLGLEEILAGSRVFCVVLGIVNDDGVLDLCGCVDVALLAVVVGHIISEKVLIAICIAAEPSYGGQCFDVCVLE